MTVKEYMLQAWRIDERIDDKIEELERIRSRIESAKGSSYSDMPRGGVGDWTDAVSSIIEIESDIKAEIMELCRIKRMVNEAIESVSDMRYRRVLELRYRNYMSWDEIASRMGYTLRNVHYLHGMALLRVRIVK